ncbi:hypothetical protein I7X12_08255 [Halosimplex litoreum]|uniref:Uncharacterized protein n=1 Tax=Halosimplex litoreum TaxID=1198301 RepID=A0A7U3WAE6_9EURY|nr:hypothetical protein [Halosimplex litoreum]QPV64591.1 hypothetical protein I7X12_08255 [Halosimplex litoreum]
MQRRAAAIYFVFFLVIGAGAYGLIQTVEEPTISLEGDTAYSAGDTVEFGDRTWEVAEADTDSGELAWVNESAVVSTTIDNGTEVPVTDVRWSDQSARMEQVFEAGSTTEYNGSDYEVSVNESAGSFTLALASDASVNESYAVGDTVTYEGNEATVTSVTGEAATIVWGGPYVLDIEAENVTDPTDATFVEQRDIAAMVDADPALYNETITQDGVEKVTYRANDTNVAVDEYFPPVERHTIAEGETLEYQGNETTVDAVTNTSVELTRPGQNTVTVGFSEGANFTVADTQYFAHFPDNSSVYFMQTSERYGDYQAQENEIASYNDRVTGLWGIAQLCLLAAILLVAIAYLPVRG